MARNVSGDSPGDRAGASSPDRRSKEWPSFRRLLANVIGDLRRRLGPLIGFELFFAAFAAAILVPFSAWATRSMISTSGKLAVGNEQIAALLLSPVGIIGIVMVATLAAAAAFARQSGMLLAAYGGKGGRSSGGAAVEVARRLPQLAALGGVQIFVHLVLFIPWLAIGLGTFSWLNSRYDLNYLVNVRPPAWWGALAVVALLVVGVLATNGRLYIRWVLALPALLFDGKPPREALRASERALRSRSVRATATLAAFGILAIAAPAVVTWLFDLVGGALLGAAGDRPRTVAAIVIGMVAAYLVASVVVGFLSFVINSLVVGRAWFAATGAREPAEETGGDTAPISARSRRVAWGLAAAVAAAAIATAVGVVARFTVADRVAITAHRGSSGRAPENSLAAIRAAIEDDADWIEIDVQRTRDGVPIVFHDADLLRVTGDPRQIRAIDFDDLREIDIGSWFDPEFASERVPTFQEVLRIAADGDVGLNVELKYNGPDPDLADAVCRAIAEEDALDRVFITSLDADGLARVREINPSIRIGYIVFQTLGKASQFEWDVLSAASRIADSGFIVSAQRAGIEVHVWTLNTREEMNRFIDLGVDNIITDYPDQLRALLEERAALSPAERLAVRFRGWLYHGAAPSAPVDAQ